MWVSTLSSECQLCLQSPVVTDDLKVHEASVKRINIVLSTRKRFQRHADASADSQHSSGMTYAYITDQCRSHTPVDKDLLQDHATDQSSALGGCLSKRRRPEGRC